MCDDERIRFTLRLSPAVYERLDKEADKLGVTKNALVSQILWEHFKPMAKKDDKHGRVANH